MTPIEAAVSALRDAADALEQVPPVLRRTTAAGGFWLGPPPPLVTSKLLRDEAQHIHDLAGEVRAADALPEDDGDFVPEWQLVEPGSSVVDEEERRWFGPMGAAEEFEDDEPAPMTFITNVYV